MDMDADSNDDDYYLNDSDDDDQLPDIETENQDKSDHTVLSKDEIRRRQNRDISEVSSLLSVSRDEAIILLRHCKWTADNVHIAFFDDETRKSLGLSTSPQNPKNPRNPNPNLIICSICFERYSEGEFVAAACGHPYCRHCWAGYMKASISDSSGCLSLRCPYPKCCSAVGESMFRVLADEEDKKRYSEFLLRSYVENSRVIKWCPAPGCEYAIEFGYGLSEVTCLCTNRFCWKCGEDAHRPVDCATVEKWMIKNCDEGENTTWILVNCKPCPQCRRQIEKNKGCMHMTCARGCGFQFCWLCLRDWSRHGSDRSISACNAYRAEPNNVEHEQNRLIAKEALARYTHYYERWLSNHNSRKKAYSDLREMATVKMKILSDIYRVPESMIRFVVEAWEQIVECRRVLKWSYAYGHYNCSEESEEEKRKKAFFEYAQGEAECWLEKLHECAEKEIEQFLEKKEGDDAAAMELGFVEYKHKLRALTDVTRGYFEKLVKGLENNNGL